MYEGQHYLLWCLGDGFLPIHAGFKICNLLKLLHMGLEESGPICILCPLLFLPVDFADDADIPVRGRGFQPVQRINQILHNR